MKNRIWLITGISSGLGKAMAQAVMAEGDFVVGTFRRQSQVDQFNSENSGKGKAILLDISDDQNIEQQVTNILDEFGRIDVLVNNASVGFAGAVEEASMDEIRNVFEPNFFGTLKMTQAVLPSMRSAKNGHIIQISSHAGVKAFPGFGIYNASKFALEGFSEALAQEVKPLGVKVTIVEPGPFRTNFAGASLLEAKNIIEDYSQTSGAFRKKLRAVHGTQEGDPMKAAAIILEYVNAGKENLRLPLGKVPLITIGMKIESLKADLEANKEFSERAVF